MLKKKSATGLKNQKYNLLFYVEDASTKVKRFATKEQMGDFIDQFNLKYPDYASIYSDNWIDLAVTDVSGEVVFFTDSMRVE